MSEDGVKSWGVAPMALLVWDLVYMADHKTFCVRDVKKQKLQQWWG